MIQIGADAFPYVSDPPQFFIERMLKYYFFVAEVRGEVVGFVDMEKISDDTAQISGIAVRKEWRKRGIGKVLMEFALRFLRSIGFYRVRVMTLRDNIQALALYNRHGFCEVETRGNVVILEKEL